VALDQCREFFGRHSSIEPVPFYDTAGSVKHVVSQRLADSAAIAGHHAAHQYRGNIIESGIEDDKRNFTRFFLIRRSTVGGLSERRRKSVPHTLPQGANKTSIAYKVKNVPGALFKSLSVFALRDISLSKIESRPWRGKPWEYVFYVDFLRGDDEAARNALRHLEEIAEFVKVLGIYKAAE
jgi:prephenate dehydratase